MHTVREYRLNAAGVYVPHVEIDGELVEVGWAPLPGSQEAFLKCSEVEVLYEGTRGNGKTIALILDFVQHVGCGFGPEWKGVLFRRTHPQLREVIALGNKYIKLLCPDATYNEMKSFWQWPTGERLTLSHFDAPAQFDDYLGHSYPWIGWEELTMWPDDGCLKVMFACSRSTVGGMPRKVRATTNPYGVGHNWVMQRYRLPLLPGAVLGPVILDAVDDKGNREPSRRVVHGHLDENLLLMVTDPEYKDRIRASARNESELRAWLDGDWSITAGGILDDIWHAYRGLVIVPSFEVPPGWRLFRAYDHGSSRPFSVGWFARSNGEDVVFSNGQVRSTVRGDLSLCGELYGWNGRPNEGLRLPIADIAKRIKEYERARGWTGRVRPGPADTAIFSDEDGRPSIAADFERAGVIWERADKGPNSRVLGWDQLRKRLIATRRIDGLRETPGLFIVGEYCPQWLRTVPTLPRDELKIDDVNSEAEDHAGDMTRYALRFDDGPSIWTRRRQVC